MIEGAVLLHDEDQVLELLGASGSVHTVPPARTVPTAGSEPDRTVDTREREREHRQQQDGANDAGSTGRAAPRVDRSTHARGV